MTRNKYQVGDRFQQKDNSGYIIVVTRIEGFGYYVDLYHNGKRQCEDLFGTEGNFERYTKLPEGNLTEALYL